MVDDNQLMTIGRWQLVGGNWLVAIGGWQLVDDNQLMTNGRWQLVGLVGDNWWVAIGWWQAGGVRRRRRRRSGYHTKNKNSTRQCGETTYTCLKNCTTPLLKLFRSQKDVV